MAKQKEKRRTLRAKARAAKKESIRQARERGERPGKSRFQQKIARKLGGGTVDPNWQWWAQRGAGGAVSVDEEAAA